MFRANVHVDECADVEKEARALSLRATRSGVSPQRATELATRFSEVLVPLIESGRLLKSHGSHLDVVRKIEGKGYTVNLKFGVNYKRGIWGRLKSLLRLD